MHLDRKDQPATVYKELRDFGITRDESHRVIFRTAQDIPKTVDERIKWLKDEVDKAQPHLIVIDLLWQFLNVSSANDYMAVMKGISDLQDALIQAKYKGALLVALHARKAVSPDNPADDILGSTSQGGSFVTTIMLKRNRADADAGYYTIMSDQTVRDETYGEIEESVISLSDGTLRLGSKVAAMKSQRAQSESEADAMRLLNFIHANPGCEMTAIERRLKMSKKTVLKLIKGREDLIRTEGEGKKGDPLKYFVHPLDDTAKLIARIGRARAQ